ncbi:MAG: hypothetical protein AAFQ80_09665 [Cyanobacteria bacterium J06621_8]
MKHIIDTTAITVFAVGIIAIPSINIKQAIAIGCDTYERVTGDFGNCNGGSTEYARQLWRERYVVCLEQQLSQAIVFYNSNSNVQLYYDGWNQGAGEELDLEELSFQNETVPPVSISKSQSSAYRRNLDLCDR